MLKTKMLKNKKGIIDQLFPLVISLVTIAIIIVVGFLIVAAGKEQVISIEGLDATGHNTANPNGTASWNATNEVQNAMADIPTWLPIIVITVIGALLIGLVSLFRRR